ncbi:MAG: FixH family protein [Sphingomonas sp.]|uniref:FixH family protein n=1 Tax=Sphingomonas sp. TaxID=28214 RepID=UPI00227469C3|nr:FixH family protein [Sphingomonas sp.]MCX8476993.1 FixH family protein [Sphingomonas sp.]
MTRPFTGRHMAAILIGFFGIVIAVNFVMATNAVRTFGGAVVDNSYVASQRFNAWLAEAHAQDAQGWKAEARGTSDGALLVALRDADGPIKRAAVTVEAEHPLGRLPGRSFALTALGDGRYAAPHALPAGRWRIRIDARAAGRDARFVEDVRL